MSLPLGDYAILGDAHTTALVSRGGSVDWPCRPRHDSPALFLRLLDDDKGGCCALHLDVPAAAVRCYVPDTNVLETTFEAPCGDARLTDFMPVYPPATTPKEGPDGDAGSRLIRTLECTRGEVRGQLRVRPTFNYARVSCKPVMGADGSVLFEAGEHRVPVASGGAASVVDGDAVVPFRLREGERLHLVLTQGQDGGASPVEDLDDARRRRRNTVRCWTEWTGRCRHEGSRAAAVRRGALFLRLMTYAPTGVIVAAPTASLPEAVPGERNFDYRFAWLRDASFTVTAFVNLGYLREAEEYIRFLRDADRSRAREVRLMYGVDGDVPEEEVLEHLSGWRGVGPVRIGNAATSQTQHDIYGELLPALDDYLEAVLYRPPARVREGLLELVGNLVDRAAAAAGELDHGIWDARLEPRHHLHSKGLFRVALDRAGRIGREMGGLEPARLERWRAAGEQVRTDYLEHGWSEAAGAYTQSCGSTVPDAAVLRMAPFDALPLGDGRLARTLEAVQAGLGAGDLIYRYRAPDGLEGEEGTFTACAFWFVGCLGLLGRRDEAWERAGRLLGRVNDVGLFAEEIDADSGEQRGNMSQGFTHMAIINHLVRLGRLEDAAARRDPADDMAAVAGR